MAQPSSSHRDRDRDDGGHSTRRSERSSSHRQRTISSTTLLLVLSLILAVLAVMLSLPNQSGAAVGGNPVDPNNPGTWAVLTPKRSQQLISRERDIAIREAEIARREAELLAGAPGGVIPNAPSCAPCVVEKVAPEPIMMAPPPIQTVIKEVVKEDALTPPGWWKDGNDRFDDILARELKIAERERDISRREETVNRREHDASRRESWIMEQLANINAANEPAVEDVYEYYDEPVAPPPPVAPPRRVKPKVQPPFHQRRPEF
ncbi:hypothetical protein PENSPDRAFT_580799 [Peniophora sp. CONT]|nr:hypothetical protein PENSPDRAFT_580799 [Peniophora sp. CONT]